MVEQYLRGNLPSRGFMIEKAQPLQYEDIDLVKYILERHDEVVIGIGSADQSHQPGTILTAGERVELTDTILKAEGIDPRKYIILPIENTPTAHDWVAEVRMLTPSWNTFYTRNFKNASMFRKFQSNYGYEVETISQQKIPIDVFELISKELRSPTSTRQSYKFTPELALNWMQEAGILNRIDVIYNRSDVKEKQRVISRELFLGRFGPLTGIYNDTTGHIGVMKQALDKRELVIVLGSAQASHDQKNPLTAGNRIEIIRNSLIENGVSPGQFYIIPVKDIASNSAFAAKVVAMAPLFSHVLAGNDWTKQLFGEGNYVIEPLQRTCDGIAKQGISSTRVRGTVTEIIKSRHTKEDILSESTVLQIEKELSALIDHSILSSLRKVKFYETMHFLAYAQS